MDILIRGMNPNVVKELDKKATKNGYSSRNEYLVKILEGEAVQELNQETENKYGNLVKAMANVVSENVKRMGELEKKITEQLTDIEYEIRNLK